jgi:hypothetical protein
LCFTQQYNGRSQSIKIPLEFKRPQNLRKTPSSNVLPPTQRGWFENGSLDARTHTPQEHVTDA